MHRSYIRRMIGYIYWTALVALLFVKPAHTQTDSDYLTPELRADVETLKAESRTAPDTRERLAWRLETLWEWGNAYALTGGPVPVDFPSTISRNRHYAHGREVPGLRNAGDRLYRILDRYVREFSLKEEHPNGIGELTFDNTGPFEAGTFQPIVQTFTVGDVPIQPGGGFVIRLNLGPHALYPPLNQAIPITITTSREGAEFRKTDTWAITGGMMYLRGGFPSFQLSGETLVKGDTVTMLLGDPDQDSAGIPVQRTSNDRVLIPTYIDFDGSGLLITPEWPSFEVVGERDVAIVHAIAPSVVAVGEPFALAIRSEDRYKNATSGPAPEYRVTVGERVLGTLAAGGAGIQEFENVVFDEAGVYRVSVASTDGTLETVSNPIWVREAPSLRIFWGDTHGHTGFAEGQGSPEGYYEFARDVARMDFISLSEHDIWMDDWEWDHIATVTAEYLEPGVFTPILGYEWTAKIQIGGHHNVFFRTPANRTRVPMQQTFDLRDLYAGLNALYAPDEVLVIPHAHQAGDWTRSDVKLERLTEITSGHGTFEFFGQRYLDNGFEVGFVGSSDNHGGHPGYTGMLSRQLGGLAAAFAAKNTPDEIFEALRARATYATTGERIILDVSLNGGSMGQRLPDAPLRTLTCSVHGTAPIDKIDIVKNGTAIHSRRFHGIDIGQKPSVQILFESESEVFTRANPRGERPWAGTITVVNGMLEEITLADFFQPFNDVFMRDFNNPNRVVFRTNTRGRGKGLLLRLSEASDQTTIHVETEPAREFPGSPGIADREPAPLPPVAFTFHLGDLTQGPDRREIEVFQNVDAISAQLAPENGKQDQVLTYTDPTRPSPGDYYYVRVQQIGGGMTWSSPIWVGD